MATKDKAQGNEGALVSVEEQMKTQLALQQRDMSKVSGGGQSINFKGGLMTVDKQPVPNNELEVIVVGFTATRAWYANAYDPDDIIAPDCYAIDTPVPHENCRAKQSDACKGCPKDKWGSAVRDGKPTRGKACREGIKLAVIPAGNLTADGIAAAEMRLAKVPPTSIEFFREFSNGLLVRGKPTFAAVCRMKCVPDAKTMFKLSFTALQAVPAECMPALLQRAGEARELVLEPYPSDEEAEAMQAEAQQAAAQASASVKF